ncbi:MAG: hypothetical protein PHN41_03950 [Bacteroidales bacterium]|jgi:hypothetical protein|nr:hypothetical protein [Bacteroidales bacterium]MDD4702766.1 hypothetical protein [Bacteroidales bacterium]
MNTKRFFAAIFVAAVLSISFFACDPKEDDVVPKPTVTNNIATQLYGFIGKNYTVAEAVLDSLGWTKTIYPFGSLIQIQYFNVDTTKLYTIYFLEDTITSSYYIEQESAEISQFKLAEKFGRFLQNFEKWEPFLYNLRPSGASFIGLIQADEGEFFNAYTDRSAFWDEYRVKKPTLVNATAGFTNEKMVATVQVFLDYFEKSSYVEISFVSRSMDINHH